MLRRWSYSTESLRVCKKISVIIPTYNREKLVAEAIESVLNQTRTIDEIIVVDDGSTDETVSVLSVYGDRIIFVKQENAGVNAARNCALDIATGSYIALLDSDDVWLPYKTALEMAALEAYPDTGFVFSDFFIWRPSVYQRSEGLRSWHRKRHNWSHIYPERISGETLSFSGETTGYDSFDVYRGDIYGPSLAEPFVLPSTAIIRRECLGGLRFDSADSTCGDWSFFSRLSKRHGSMYVDRETTLNRSHDDDVRLTRIDQSTQLERRLSMTQDVWGSDVDFQKANPGQVGKVEVKLLHRLAKLELISERAESAVAYLDQAGSLSQRTQVLERMLLRVLAKAPSVLALGKRVMHLPQRCRR